MDAVYLFETKKRPIISSRWLLVVLRPDWILFFWFAFWLTDPMLCSADGAEEDVPQSRDGDALFTQGKRLRYDDATKREHEEHTVGRGFSWWYLQLQQHSMLKDSSSPHLTSRCWGTKQGVCGCCCCVWTISISQRIVNIFDSLCRWYDNRRNDNMCTG